MLKEIGVSRQYAPLRVCADICFYFYAVSIFTFSVQYFTFEGGDVLGVVSNLVAPWSRQLTVMVAACFVLGLFITRIQSGPLRFLLSLLPGLVFLLIPFRPVVLILLAAWVYYVIYMTVGSFEVHLDLYRRRGRLMLFVAMMLTLCLIIFHFGTEDWYYNRLFGGELYGALFFVFCVLSLRGMRTDLGAPKMMRALDAAFVVGLPLTLLGAFFLLRLTVPAITSLFRQLTRLLLWLRPLFPERDVPEELPPEEDDLSSLFTHDPFPLPIVEEQHPDPGSLGGEGLKIQLPEETSLWFTVALLAVVLLLIAYWLIRRKWKAPALPHIVHEKIEMTPLREGLLRRAPREAPAPAHVRQIRRIYRSYLQRMRALNMKLSPSDTSEDVLAHAGERLDRPENETLRELYIAARYGDPKAVTAAQAAEAQRCLNAIEAAGRRLPGRS